MGTLPGNQLDAGSLTPLRSRPRWRSHNAVITAADTPSASANLALQSTSTANKPSISPAALAPKPSALRWRTRANTAKGRLITNTACATAPPKWASQ